MIKTTAHLSSNSICIFTFYHPHFSFSVTLNTYKSIPIRTRKGKKSARMLVSKMVKNGLNPALHADASLRRADTAKKSRTDTELARVIADL